MYGIRKQSVRGTLPPLVCICRRPLLLASVLVFLVQCYLTPEACGGVVGRTTTPRPPSSTTATSLSKTQTQKQTYPQMMETGGSAASNSSNDPLNLERIRASLTSLEDTIIFCLIERSKFLVNSPAYHSSSNFSYNYNNTNNDAPACGDRASQPQPQPQSLVRYVIEATETVHAYGNAKEERRDRMATKEGRLIQLLALEYKKAGRYVNPAEEPIFVKDLPTPLIHPNYTEVLHPAGASININQNLSDLYFNQMLPLFARAGDDGNYASTAAADLACLQALSTRIHLGKFVAESKFKAAPGDYEASIGSKVQYDKNKLLELLTVVKQEEAVKRRVVTKASMIGQGLEVDDASTASSNDSTTTYKVDPKVVGSIYDRWVIPLTKIVEVEYLLRRLD